MRLHVSATSPYVRKVLVLLHETGQIDHVERVEAGGTPVETDRMPLAQNPLGKIPVLERDDGPALHDSRVICRYFDAAAGAGLYPPAPRLWETLTLESMADGMMDAAAAMVYERRFRTPETMHPGLMEGWWAKIARAVAALEARWMGHLAGPMDMGQIALAAALGYVDFRHPDRDWRGAAPALSGWYGRFAQRPAMQATAPPSDA